MSIPGKKIKLFRMINNASIHSIGMGVVVLLCGLSIAIISQTFVTFEQIDNVSHTWESHDQNANAKTNLLSKLHHALGYGGTIHKFKDFVLRQDRMSVIRIESDLRKIESVLMDYSELPITEEEARALVIIDEMLIKYENAMATAEKMAMEGASAFEIDEAVRIDDEPALAAMASLAQEVDKVRVESAALVYESVGRIKSITYLTSAIIGIGLLILMVSFIWFARVRLTGPLIELRNVMVRLARGETDVEISTYERNDEIGAMSKAVEVFKDNLSKRLEADRKLVEAYEELQVSNENIKLSEERFEGILNIAPEAIISINSQGLISLFNQGAEECFGYSADEILGKPLEILLPNSVKDHHASYVEVFRNSHVSRRTMKSRNSIQALRKGGIEFPAEAAISKLEQNGETIFTVMLHDITERKRAEEINKAAKEEAELANRTKSEFLANMSHELRTPLNGVLGMASVLMHSDLTPDQSDQVKVISESGDALLKVLNDILDLSKVEAGRLDLDYTDFLLSDLIDSITDLWQPRFEANNVALSANYDAQGSLYGDPTRIRQVLNNLINNAQKFTESGSVTISAHETILDNGDIELNFSIADTGIGIAQDKISELFDKFSQADTSITRKYGGTGLGLAICQRFVEVMGGQITVESIPGVGSTFSFSVKCQRGQPIEPVNKPDDIYDARKSDNPDSIRILVAEDNKVNQRVIQAILTRSHYSCDVVGNGLEAVSAVMRSQYDLILMDIQMPELDGIGATKAIRELPGNNNNIPIVALTAHAMSGDRERYLASGMNAYVSKPIKPQDLFEAIDTCLGPRAHRLEEADARLDEPLPKAQNM